MKQKNNTLNEIKTEIGRGLSNLNDLNTDLPFSKEINELRDELSQNLAKISGKLNITNENQKFKDREMELLSEIKGLDKQLKSIYERVGLEVYGSLDSDYSDNREVTEIYNNLKKGEVETEGLERELYKYENNMGKKNFFTPVINGIKLSTIKSKIESLNKKNLGLIQKLGLYFLGHNGLPGSISQELLLDFAKFSEALDIKKKSIDDIRKKIEKNNKKLHEFSSNIEIDLKNNKLEKQISELCYALGDYILSENKTSGYSIDVDIKIKEALDIKNEIEITSKQEDLDSYRKNLEAISLDIQKKEESLKASKARRKDIQEEIKSLESWLELNTPSKDVIDNG